MIEPEGKSTADLASERRARREDPNAAASKRTGFAGLFERTLRRARGLVVGTVFLGMMGFVGILLGIALMPAMYFVPKVFSATTDLSNASSFFFRGVSIAFGFLSFGFSLICIVPLANWPIRAHVKPFRGGAYSAGVVGWYLHNILAYAVRYTFLDWITPSPFNLFFFRRMGMKIGKRVEVNTSNVSDPAMITLEDGVIIGGSASLLAHYAVEGYLVIAPVVIRKNATIGLRAIIMGGVEIGERARVLPNSVVLPKTVIPAGETWAGVPAKKLER